MLSINACGWFLGHVKYFCEYNQTQIVIPLWDYHSSGPTSPIPLECERKRCSNPITEWSYNNPIGRGLIDWWTILKEMTGYDWNAWWRFKKCDNL